jgi:hypothetical protein
MPHSESTAKLSAALAKAQTKFTTIKKDKVGQEGNLKFSYAALPDALTVVRPLLNEQGIYLSQPIVEGPDGILRQTTKVQLGEEWDQSDGLPLPKLTPGKELGKIVTYARRVDLFPFLGVSGEDDDEDAPDLLKPGSSNKPYTPQPPKPTFTKTINTPKAAEKAVAKAVSKPTDFPFGKNANVATVGGATQGGNPEITDDDIPNFDTPIDEQEPLSPEAEAAAQAMDTPEPLDQKRYNEIQERLKEIATKKLGGVTTKSLSAFLEARHRGKKLVYVPAVTAENTLKLIEEAVEGGPAKVKELFNSVKEKNG